MAIKKYFLLTDHIGNKFISLVSYIQQHETAMLKMKGFFYKALPCRVNSFSEVRTSLKIGHSLSSLT